MTVFSKPSMFDGIKYARSRTIDEHFREHMEANPEVYRLLVRYAREAKGAGHRRYSIEAVVARVRWHTSIEVKDPSGFKFNDHLTSRYARLLMYQERCARGCDGCPDPECLAGLFETRRLHS